MGVLPYILLSLAAFVPEPPTPVVCGPTLVLLSGGCVVGVRGVWALVSPGARLATQTDCTFECGMPEFDVSMAARPSASFFRKKFGSTRTANGEALCRWVKAPDDADWLRPLDALFAPRHFAVGIVRNETMPRSCLSLVMQAVQRFGSWADHSATEAVLPLTACL